MVSSAAAIARRAGAMARNHADEVTARTKADGTWVTEADRAVEDFITQQLADAFPDHHVCGEETAADIDISDGNIWLVDPIDGTTNYVAGLPVWAVSMCLLSDGLPKLGIVYLPMTDELFTAGPDQPPECNGAALRIHPDRGLDSHSLIAVNSEAIGRIGLERMPGKIRNMGAMAAHACYTASGAMVASTFHHWHAWDIAAGFYIAWQAGAVAKYADGRRLEGFGDLPVHQAGECVLLGPECAVDEALNIIHQRRPL